VLVNNNEDLQSVFINRNHNAKEVVKLPFDQVLKRKVVVRGIDKT